jgi:NAD(P)-dependent dehydrogenase (short-subunit alcohol dehydrogenase family)
VTLRLQGSVALVTGAGAGIGLASAERLAAEGARIVCVDADEGSVEQTVRRIEAGGGQAIAIRADVRRSDELDAAVEEALRAFGCLDVAVANAGINREGAALDVDPADWQLTIDVNLTGVWNTIRSALRPMVEQRRGSIVALASVAAVAGVPNTAAYAAAKGGVLALCRQVAVDYAGAGIRVNAVCPGPIETPMVERALLDRAGGDTTRVAELALALASQYPLGRIGSPDDVAALVAFLASDDSSWITGGAHVVDGGISSAMRPPAPERWAS